MQLQLALLLSQISMPIQTCLPHACFPWSSFLSWLFLCLFVYWFSSWFVWEESPYGLQQIWAVCHELLGSSNDNTNNNNNNNNNNNSDNDNDNDNCDGNDNNETQEIEKVST